MQHLTPALLKLFSTQAPPTSTVYMATQTPLPLSIRLVQAIGMSTSACLCGSIATFSYVLIPVIDLSPAPLLARQWAKAYSIGASVAPPMAVAATVAWAWLAAKASSSPTTSTSLTSPFTLYTIAAVLTPSIVPYTLTVMAPVNNALAAKAAFYANTPVADKGAGEDQEVRRLVRRWMWFNAVRAVLVGVGCVAGGWAVVG
ncbi:hypothetical protein BJ546DRAFT_960082 [Cryomyces antarcticus]